MWFHRHLLQVGGNISTNFTTNANNFDIDTGFPPDLFTANEVKSGAVLLYIIGTLTEDFKLLISLLANKLILNNFL